MMDRNELFKTLARQRNDEVVIYTMSAMKEWPDHSDSPLDFFVSGGMSYASSVGLGIALAQPTRRVWILDGDGSLLMNLGTLVTIAEQAPPNLIHFVLSNGLYEVAGRVPIPGQGKVDFPALARSSGLQKVYEYQDLIVLQDHLSRLLQESGPLFVNLVVSQGLSKSRDKVTAQPVEMVKRVAQSLKTG
jgi:sulfopyruvate decarboxylase subunit beta